AEGSVEPKHKSDGREAPLGSRVPVGACDSFWLLTHHLRGGFAFAAASRPGRGTATCKLRNANYGFSESLTPTCRSSCKGEPEQVASDQSWFYGRVMTSFGLAGRRKRTPSISFARMVAGRSSSETRIWLDHWPVVQ